MSTPKTGTHSVYEVLMKEPYNAEFAVKSSIGKRYFHHNKINAVPDHKKYYKFTAIRNPFERTVSMWWFFIGPPDGLNRKEYTERFGGNTFEDFTNYLKRKRKIHDDDWIDKNWPYYHLNIPQHIQHNGTMFDKYIHTENINKEFNELPFLQDHIDLPNEFSNKHQRTNWWEYYTPKAEKNIKDIYSIDFKNFKEYPDEVKDYINKEVA